MRSIWKFHVPLITREQSIVMPVGARPLTVQTQKGLLCIWAMVDTDAPPGALKVRIYGTGHEITTNLGYYLDTVQLTDGTVWHFFLEHMEAS